ncbi:uncharacterized protein F4807DRAFT_101833 [Annulohypoxylon truncatum]|uniref:uncharacterized protein n=1 Tax=Annulohypoxylon truncatum TaxID=327061 RepID=UPI002008E376|nr:uncharacterized protein F4807DRAFT_101833 [Annulohypoxylon truncatum]KAI1209249.1 hypothetical protein F4807DRAFT_101833 [Annulohypoxylon truncatum]
MASTHVQPSRFQWKQSKLGTWEREADECETFYIQLKRNGNAYYPIIGCASFVTKSPDTRTTDEADRKENGVRRMVYDALLKAWEVLCYEHPTLRSRIEHDKASGICRRVYSTFQDVDEQKVWLNATFKAIYTDEDPLQWFNSQEHSFDGSRLLVVTPENNNDFHPTIFLQCPHDITDGVGILQLVDQLFQHAARAYEQGDQYTLPAWGDEHERLSPGLRLAATLPETPSEAQVKRFAEIQTQNGSIYTHPGLLSLPPSSSTAASSGKRHRLSIFVPQAITSQIIRKCKEIAPGVSVTHVFMSALAMALSEIQPRKEESYAVRYVNHSMINLRPYCQTPYSTPAHAAAPYHTVSAQALGIDLIVPGPSNDAKDEGRVNELRKLAIQVRDFYKAVRPASMQDEQVVLSPLMFASLTTPPGSDPHAVSDPPFCPAVISSIGNIGSIVSATHGAFELTNVWAASEPIGAGVAMFLDTWNGKIELSGVFDTRYHDAEYIKKFLGRILDCVSRGLDVDE